MHTACTRHVHCLRPACLLRVCTACALHVYCMCTPLVQVIAVVGKDSGNGGLRRDFSHAELRVSGLDELRISQLKEVADREPEQTWMMPLPEPFWGDDD